MGHDDMSSPLSIKFKTATLVTFLAVLFAGVTGATEWRPPAGPVELVTRYTQGAVPGIGENASWTLVPRRVSTGFSLDYFLNGKQRFCTVDVESGESGFEVELLDARGNSIDSATGSFLPMVGFPAPCRIITTVPEETESNFTIHRRAGGRRFTSTYRLLLEPMPLEQAMGNKWIEPGFFPEEEEPVLVLMTVMDTESRVLFRQLWQEKGDWWLFEETPHARTWRRKVVK